MSPTVAACLAIASACATAQPAGSAAELDAMKAELETDLRKAIAAHDTKAFETSYRQAMSQCHGCHTAAEKPYLLPRIPEAPATRMIDVQR
jgi:cytochrome c553